jgi:hypothetical protein
MAPETSSGPITLETRFNDNALSSRHERLLSKVIANGGTPIDFRQWKS